MTNRRTEMASDVSRLSEQEKLRIIDDMTTDPRYEPPPHPLTKEAKLELFEMLAKKEVIRLTSLIPRSERLRIVDEQFKNPQSPIPWEMARSVPEAVKLEMFDDGVESGAIQIKWRD
jgi:hypothetical protein